MSKHGRRKGHDWERSVARDIRGIGYDATTTRETAPHLDAEGFDINTTAPVLIQCKTGVTVTPIAALRRLIKDSGNTHLLRAVLAKDTGQRMSYAVLPYDDFLVLLAILKSLHCGKSPSLVVLEARADDTKVSADTE